MRYSSQLNSRDYSVAMEKAIQEYSNPRVIKRTGDKILFNGFWRSGERQNVCLWTDKATWHDAKTGEGGGCKEFAKTAFNLNLPEFMERFGDVPYENRHTSVNVKKILKVKPKPVPTKPISKIWAEIDNAAFNNKALALRWVKQERGFHNMDKFVGSGFTCFHESYLDYFEKHHHGFLKNRLAIGNQLIAPLRSVYSDEVKNIFFRTISPCDKNEKTRLLPDAGGWSEADKTPRAFGFPHLIKEFPNLVLCEGMADYFAAECLLEENDKYLPIGVANADAIITWAQWLKDNKYSGHISLIYQMDKDTQGNPSKKTIGPLKALQALAHLKNNGLKASLFDWPVYLKNTTTHPDEIQDLADCLKAEATYQECGPGHLSYLFLALLNLKEVS
jgi:hypothetical protein